jgi:hypothetical protein
MECYTHCQSCGIDMNRPELYGSEHDGTRSTIYCIHCYRDGAFVRPGQKIEDMEACVRRRMRRSGASESEIGGAVAMLPVLVRWILTPEDSLHRMGVRRRISRRMAARQNQHGI